MSLSPSVAARDRLPRTDAGEVEDNRDTVSEISMNPKNINLTRRKLYGIPTRFAGGGAKRSMRHVTRGLTTRLRG
jgi:hypothetical protein